jgi:ATP-binding cassette subfamily B protein
MRALGRAMRYLRRYRGATTAALVALVLVSAANLAAPQVVRIAIDDGLVPEDARIVLHGAVALIVIAVLRGLLNWGSGYLAERASQGVAFDLREGLFERIQKLSFSYYDRAQTGQLVTRLTNDVEMVRLFVGTGAIQLGAALAMLLGSAVLLFVINVKLAAVALACIVPIFWLLKRFIGRVGPLFGRVQIGVARINTVLQENLQGLRVVRAFSAEARERARYEAINTELRDLNVGVIRAISLNFPFVNMFGNLGTLAIVGVGGVLIFGGGLTIGELVAFNSYLGFLLVPIVTMGFLSAMMARAGASALRVFELLDAPIEVTDRPGAVPLPAIAGRVELEEVRFRYAGAEREILRGVSFTVEPGQLVAVLGTTGSGKSTLINLVPRFYDVTAGAVRIDGHDVRDVTLSSLRSKIGVVLQDALLFSGTVRDNIAYGRPDASQAEIEAAARAAQAAEFIAALPEGYDTAIGERGVGLSGGQRQRIAIARALLTDPHVLILDDSTSAVDAETEMAIRAALDKLMRDRNNTAIVIAQRISTVRDADQIIVLDEGRVAARGTHDELYATSRLYRDILGSQLVADSDGATAVAAEAAS